KMVTEELLTSLINIILQSDYSSAQVEAARAIKSLADIGVLDKEMVIEKLLIPLNNNLQSRDSMTQTRAARAIKSLADAGVLDKEMVTEKLLTSLINIILQSDYSLAQVEAARAIKSLADAGIWDKEMVTEKLLTSLINIILQSDDSWAQVEVARAIKSLADIEVLDKKMVKKKIDLSKLKRPVPEQFRYYYLRLLETLEDNPIIAYQMISAWSPEEMSEFVQILDYFVKCVALNSSYGTEISNSHFLERSLITSALFLINDPKAFLSHLRQKIKITISDNSIKLAIKVYEVASVNAARGLIKVLGLDKDNVIILYDNEIDSEQAGRFFPEYDTRAFSGFTDRGFIRIEFHDYGNMKIVTSGDFLAVSLPYTPFKFNLPERGSEEELSSAREALGIGARKVIVIGSPSDVEFNEFIRSYNSLYDNLPYAQRPLLIIGFRQRRNENELRLLGSLSGQSIAVRSDANAVLPNVTSNNVLILNTAGELLKMYALADVAIVGQDRNIFEPVSQKAAILYFEGNWQNNGDAKEMLAEAGAVQVFSRENLEQLITDSDKARQMAEKRLKAVEAYKKKIESKAIEFALQIIGTRTQLINKLINASSTPLNTSNERTNVSRTTSSSAQVRQEEGQFRVPANTGGIDFRTLPIVTQAVTSLSANISSSVLQNLVSINLEEEWSQIERMTSSGITPSSQRLKEYIQTSCAQDSIFQVREKILLCISDILRLQEERCDYTDATLRDILVVLESIENTQDLRQVFLGKGI
ncbi:MAG: hypothetical protein QMD94_04020, partial [Candidatus Omnitrophota bacterium]|nr:hypothetical protein [Candidatus Omnitrophota bacterium]